MLVGIMSPGCLFFVISRKVHISEMQRGKMNQCRICMSYDKTMNSTAIKLSPNNYTNQVHNPLHLD